MITPNVFFTHFGKNHDEVGMAVSNVTDPWGTEVHGICLADPTHELAQLGFKLKIRSRVSCLTDEFVLPAKLALRADVSQEVLQDLRRTTTARIGPSLRTVPTVLQIRDRVEKATTIGAVAQEQHTRDTLSALGVHCDIENGVQVVEETSGGVQMPSLLLGATATRRRQAPSLVPSVVEQPPKRQSTGSASVRSGGQGSGAIPSPVPAQPAKKRRSGQTPSIAGTSKADSSKRARSRKQEEDDSESEAGDDEGIPIVDGLGQEAYKYCKKMPLGSIFNGAQAKRSVNAAFKWADEQKDSALSGDANHVRTRATLAVSCREINMKVLLHHKDPKQVRAHGAILEDGGFIWKPEHCFVWTQRAVREICNEPNFDFNDVIETLALCPSEKPFSMLDCRLAETPGFTLSDPQACTCIIVSLSTWWANPRLGTLLDLYVKADGESDQAGSTSLLELGQLQCTFCEELVAARNEFNIETLPDSLKDMVDSLTGLAGILNPSPGYAGCKLRHVELITKKTPGNADLFSSKIRGIRGTDSVYMKRLVMEYQSCSVNELEYGESFTNTARAVKDGDEDALETALSNLKLWQANFRAGAVTPLLNDMVTACTELKLAPLHTAARDSPELSEDYLDAVHKLLKAWQMDLGPSYAVFRTKVQNLIDELTKVIDKTAGETKAAELDEAVRAFCSANFPNESGGFARLQDTLEKCIGIELDSAVVQVLEECVQKLVGGVLERLNQGADVVFLQAAISCLELLSSRVEDKLLPDTAKRLRKYTDAADMIHSHFNPPEPVAMTVGTNNRLVSMTRLEGTVDKLVPQTEAETVLQQHTLSMIRMKLNQGKAVGAEKLAAQIQEHVDILGPMAGGRTDGTSWKDGLGGIDKITELSKNLDRFSVDYETVKAATKAAAATHKNALAWSSKFGVDVPLLANLKKVLDESWVTIFEGRLLDQISDRRYRKKPELKKATLEATVKEICHLELPTRLLHPTLWSEVKRLTS